MISLVTGATGFVGSAVARRLLEAGHEVRALARAGSVRTNLEGLPLDVRTGDLRDRVSLDAALRGCDTLFHVAADYRLWTLRSEDLYESNVQGTLNVLEAAVEAGVRRIVYTSSVATLGLNDDGSPSHETTPVTLADMIGHYKRSKFIAERKVTEGFERDGWPVVIVNPSTPIGPRDIKPTPTGRVIQQAAAGKMPAYVETGLNIAHVDDVAEGHWQAFEHGEPGERYILGGEDWRLRDILHEVARLTGHKPPRVKLDHRVVMPLAYLVEGWARAVRYKGEPMLCVDGVRMSTHLMFFSSAKAERALGYRPRPARDALADAVDWFQRHGYV